MFIRCGVPKLKNCFNFNKFCLTLIFLNFRFTVFRVFSDGLGVLVRGRTPRPLLYGGHMKEPFKLQMVAYENLLPSEIVQFSYLTNATSINRLMMSKDYLKVDVAAWALIEIDRSNRRYLILKDLSGRMFRLYEPDIVEEFYRRSINRNDFGFRIVSLEFFKEECEPLSCCFIVQSLEDEI